MKACGTFAFRYRRHAQPSNLIMPTPSKASVEGSGTAMGSGTKTGLVAPASPTPRGNGYCRRDNQSTGEKDAEIPGKIGDGHGNCGWRFIVGP